MATICLAKFVQFINKREIRTSSSCLKFFHKSVIRPLRVMSSLSGDKSSASETASNYLKLLELNPKRLTRIRFLGELFRSNGYELKIAGGAVRDLVNNIEPIDIDLATDAHPNDTLKLVEKHPDLLRVIVTTAGQRHGTVAVKFKEVEDLDLRKRLKLINDPEWTTNRDDLEKEPVYDQESPYEITTLRCDKITDGRHAEVEFINDWKLDAERRDLTINSMFLNLDDGKLIDYFGGEQDCRNNIVRFVGLADQRIKEDYLRILRYFRFWLRFSDKEPCPDQLNAIKANLDGLNQISGERIWQELKKTFSHLPCSRVIKVMLDIDLFRYTGLEDNDIVCKQKYTEEVIKELQTVEENILRYSNECLTPKLKKYPTDLSLKQTKDLLPVIVFSKCIRTTELCLKAHERLKFSNSERNILLFLIENKHQDPSFNNLKYQLAIVNRSDRSNVLRCLKALLICNGKFENIEKLETWEIPLFPLDGKLVAQVVRDKKLPKSSTKEVIERVKSEWAKKDCQIDKQEVENIMQSVVNDMVVTESN